MKKMKQGYLFSIGLILGVLIVFSFSPPPILDIASDPIIEPEESDVAYAAIVQDDAEEAFHKMMKVLTHPRCTNCHPQNNEHLKLGGATNLGIENKQCSTCHQDSNNKYSGVPGAPDWAMAPPSMGWQGLNKYEIARAMMDREKNGNRSPEDIMHHLTEHELVLWAWEPGVHTDGTPREKPSVPKEEYIKAVKEWIEAGAIIPEEK